MALSSRATTVQHHNYGPQPNTGVGQNIIIGSSSDVYGVRDSLVRDFTTNTFTSNKALWDAIAGVGASHKAEQQFSRGECLEGTREEALRIIHYWRVAREQDHPICWLSGAAGVGKSAIAMTIAKSCEENGLVTSFFFFRSDPRRNNPSALILTIAHGLVTTMPSVRNLIHRRLSAAPQILEASLEEQFRELVLKPLLPPRKPMVAWFRRLLRSWADRSGRRKDPNLVIIDGLDECSDAPVQLRILAAIADSYQHSPRSPLRFLICSRPESWIRQAFNAQPLRDITQGIVLDDTFSPAKDIERYLVHELEGIRQSPKYKYIEFPTPWPSKEDLECLIRRSDGQFVYVVTAVGFLKDPHYNPVKQLRVIIDNVPVNRLARSPYQELDILYHVVLDANSDHDKVLLLLAAIIILPISLDLHPSPELVEPLLGLENGEAAVALQTMHSVLKIHGSKDAIRCYHTSFTDFLFDQTRSGVFHIDKATHSHVLAERWLQALSHERVEQYSLNQLYEFQTCLLFTKWVDFCLSLPAPSRSLLDGLRNLDTSAVFICLCVPSQEVYMDWYGAFSPVVRWLKSSFDHVEPEVIERFRTRPRCFHLKSPVGSPEEVDIIHWAVLNLAGCNFPSSRMVRANTARMSYMRESGHPFPLRITDCRCNNNGTEDLVSSNHPGHRTYQDACLQTLEALVSDFRSTASEESLSTFDDANELNNIFRNVVDSSLLLQCGFETSLFPLCQTFFASAQSCSSLTMTVAEREALCQKLLKWLEMFPDREPHEAEGLRSQIISLFS